MPQIDLKNLPQEPGIYIYRNKESEIIYVGKAINLKKRISQYFQREDALGPKTKSLVSQINSIETKIVGSEIEALILEASYIKKHRPKFNSLLKDDRSYQYICITRDRLPRIFSVFESTKVPHADYYGPFPAGTYIKSLLKTLRRLYPYYGLKPHPHGLCLYCHLHLCPGPAPNPSDYRKNISKIKKILTGKFKLIQKQLANEIKNYSLVEQYEQAQKSKDELIALNYIVTGWNNLRHLYAHINLPEDDQSQAVNELLTTLSPYLPISKLNRIECYDISQMVTRHFVGSMTVWQNGRLDHTEYRQFRINNVIARNPERSRKMTKQSRSEQGSANDPFMIREVVDRRLQHPEWQYPDLIVVDGGKPQVSAALNVIARNGVMKSEIRRGGQSRSGSPRSARDDVSIIGLAKKFETIVINHQNNWIEINLPKNSKALRLLTSLRDEAHRFANRYRKLLMKKSIEL